MLGKLIYLLPPIPIYNHHSHFIPARNQGIYSPTSILGGGGGKGLNRDDAFLVLNYQNQ